MLLPSPPAVVAVVEDGEDDGGAVVDPEVAEGGDDVSMARERKRERREIEGVSEGQNKVSRGEFNFSHSLFLNDHSSLLSSSSPCQAVAVEYFEVCGFLNFFIILLNHRNQFNEFTIKMMFKKLRLLQYGHYVRCSIKHRTF